ncbi:MAG: dephospho-CoA kinase [Firmicutes bacterium]|nr:dephospho-CoA kinase [Bacillota bacterium]
MKVIGLTGGTGSGKSIVSAFLQQNGAYIIDADEIAHGIIERGKPAYEELTNYFGGAILDQDRNILRKKLGSIVFTNKEKLDFLNRCTHKYISQEIDKQIAERKKKQRDTCIVLDAPLLLEAKLENRCNEIWVVFAEEEVRARRIMERDNITYQEAKNRIGCQKNWDFYRQKANLILDNSKDLQHLKRQLEAIFYVRIRNGEKYENLY